MGYRSYAISVMEQLHIHAEQMVSEDFEALSPGIGCATLRPTLDPRRSTLLRPIVERPARKVTDVWQKLGIENPGTISEIEPFEITINPKPKVSQAPEVAPATGLDCVVPAPGPDCVRVVREKAKMPSEPRIAASPPKPSLRARAVRQTAKPYFGAPFMRYLIAIFADTAVVTGGGAMVVACGWLAVSQSLGYGGGGRFWESALGWARYFKPAELAFGFSVIFGIYHLVFRLIVGKTVGQAMARHLRSDWGATEQAI